MIKCTKCNKKEAVAFFDGKRVCRDCFDRMKWKYKVEASKVKRENKIGK